MAVRVENRKTGDSSHFERGQIVGARLAGESVAKKNAKTVYRERHFLGLCRHTRIMGKTISAKRNSGQKSTLTERDHPTLRRIVSKHNRTTGTQVNCSRTEYSSCRPCFLKNCPTSTVGLQLPNLRLLKVMLRCVNDGVTTIKPGHQTTGNGCVIWSDESSFTLYPTSGRVCVWRTPT
jgi:hypothetical protein